jgi:hypothetical protein
LDPIEKDAMENKTTKRIILSCAVLLAVACICLVVLILSGVGVTLLWPLEASQETVVPTSTLESQAPDDENLPLPEEDLPKELADTLFAIESQVRALRGLEVKNPVERTLISSLELEKIVVEDFFAEYSDEDAQQDLSVLSLLGLLPDDFGLKAFYQDLYSEQIAGFYDDEVKQIYVVQGEDFGGNEKLTYAHEFTHVLQDQTFDLSDGLGLNDEACEEDSEKCAAVQALIEGDATKTEILWFQENGSLRDYRDIQEFYSNFSSPILDNAPPYMAADLVFPYEKGLAFVEQLYDQGGYAAVDRAYQDLPVSTEQILHPEKYPGDTPSVVALPDLGSILGESWSLLDQNVMGEWYTFLILNKGYEEASRLDQETAAEAAEGWGGDAYAFYQDNVSGDALFVMDAVWDTAGDADEFAAAFAVYAAGRWGDPGTDIAGHPTWGDGDATAVLIHEGDRTLWILATARDLIPPILDQFSFE